MAMEDEDASWLMAVRGARKVVEGLDPLVRLQEPCWMQLATRQGLPLTRTF